MRLFNAFQIAVLYGVFPMIMEWLTKASFTGHDAVWWVAVVAYIVLFVGTVAAWRSLIHDIDGK